MRYINEKCTVCEVGELYLHPGGDEVDLDYHPSVFTEPHVACEKCKSKVSVYITPDAYHYYVPDPLFIIDENGNRCFAPKSEERKLVIIPK